MKTRQRYKQRDVVSAHNYLPADDSVLFNDDKGLRPIRLSLPQPPRLELIDGYGLPPEEQMFKRIEIPFKLRALEERCIRDLKDNRNKAFVITNFKIQERYWQLLESERRHYKDEIEWIKKCWWHRLYGYWFFNKGKPTYIDGWHWTYLNFWYIPEVSGGYPRYRIADRDFFIFCRYAHTTTETFADIDDKGRAQTNRYGVYEMRDVGKRICYGVLDPKNRRGGDTHKGLLIGWEIVSRTVGTDGFGIMSYTADNAEKHLTGKLVPAWNKWPLFFKPFTSSPNDPQTIVNNVPSNEFVETGLRNEVTYAKTSSSMFYNGKMLIASLLDEEGQTVEVDVGQRWGIIQSCLSQGNGSVIHGWALHPSTVEEYMSGGKAYKGLANQSDFYVRNANGQTLCGLFRIFTPAYKRLDGFIDKYGHPVDFTPLAPIDGEDGRLVRDGAIRYLQDKRNALLRDGKPESLLLYRQNKRQFPMEWSDCWLGEAGNIGWNLEILDRRCAELDRLDETERGNFEWANGIVDSSVIWKSSPDGRWVVSNLFTNEGITNRKIQYWWVDPISGHHRLAWRPMFPQKFTSSGDPNDYASKSEAKMRETKTRQSLFGGMVFQEHDERLDPGELISEWNHYGVVCEYLNLVPTEVGYEDMIKMIVYFGGLFYPEINKTGLWEYIIKRGYAGYLKYDVDPQSGKIKEKPGSFTLQGSKDEGFRLLGDYITFRGARDKHKEWMEQARRISGPEQLKDFDLLTALMLCLLGSKSSYAKVISQINDSPIDLGKFMRGMRGR